jgi:hypothetical protein
VTAKGKGTPLDLPRTKQVELERRVKELCEDTLGREDFALTLSLVKPVPLQGETLQAVLDALKNVGYVPVEGRWKQVHPGENLYWVNARNNWTREYRVYMNGAYEWTLVEPDGDAPNQEVSVLVEPDGGISMDLKCAGLSPNCLCELLDFVKKLAQNGG